MNDPGQHAWFSTALGRAVLEREARVVADALGDVFGFELLQIGCWGGGAALSAQARTQHRRCLAPDAAGPGAVRCGYDALPVATSSVEAVLLPHTLEHAAHPHALLREVERVLMGEGTVIACGFNPIGPWGVRHLLARRTFPPPVARLLNEGRLRDWLGLLGFEVTDLRRYLFVPPWPQRISAGGRDWLERHGARVAPPLAGAYLLKARKRVRALTQIRPAWRRAPVVVGGVAEHAPRNAA
jgi:SAM-dependent methyltransferase